MAYDSWTGGETFVGERGDRNGNRRLDGGETAQQYVGSSWNTVQLGYRVLPGVCTIEGLRIGLALDIVRVKGKEKACVRDLGISPKSFKIICEIRASQWQDWLEVSGDILPREGKGRSPVTIQNPMVNAAGIQNVYIESVAFDSPSARKGMRIEISVTDWLDAEPKPAKGATSNSAAQKAASAGQNNPNVPKYAPPNYTGDPKKLAQRMADNQGLQPADSATILQNTFGTD